MERSADHGDGGGGGGSGPSPLERRVAVLEEKVDRIEATVHRIEMQLAEIIAELRHLPKMSDYVALRSEMTQANAALRADMAEMRGKLSGVESRFSQIPTIWQIIAVQSAFTFGIAAIIFAVGNYLRP